MHGDGDSFEYTGTGLEKFLGFLVAIVILAIYLGIVQMLLFYFGLNLFTEPRSQTQMLAQLAAIYITFFAVLPLLLFAQYRARRYKMSRSRWRGIRFGMDNGAWGYVFRALGYYLLVIISLGILTPLATFKLEKYMVDRSWYGDAKFEQNGKWTALYGGLKWVFIGILLFVFAMFAAAVLESIALSFIGFIGGYVILLVGLVYYRIYAINKMAEDKLLDGQIGFSSEARTGEVMKVMIIGGIGIGVIFAVVGGGSEWRCDGSWACLDDRERGAGCAGHRWSVVLWRALMVGGLSLIWITQPIISHVVQHITVLNAGHLDTIRQRAADAGADAEGFADALDIGGAL